MVLLHNSRTPYYLHPMRKLFKNSFNIYIPHGLLELAEVYFTVLVDRSRILKFSDDFQSSVDFLFFDSIRNKPGFVTARRKINSVFKQKVKEIIEQRMIGLRCFIKIRNCINMEKDAHHGAFPVDAVLNVFRIQNFPDFKIERFGGFIDVLVEVFIFSDEFQSGKPGAHSEWISA